MECHTATNLRPIPLPRTRKNTLVAIYEHAAGWLPFMSCRFGRYAVLRMHMAQCMNESHATLSLQMPTCGYTVQLSTMP